MKKLILLTALALVVTGFAAAQVSAGKSAWVSVKTLKVKSGTGFFAGTKGTLASGDQVTVLQVKGNNAEVRSSKNSSLSGWVPVSSLSARLIVGGASAASSDEVALAGKGFSQEVENAYKAEGELNYADVDKTEAITVADKDLQAFITEGHLKAGE